MFWLDYYASGTRSIQRTTTRKQIIINSTCTSIREVLFAFFNGGSARRNDCETVKFKLTTFRLKAIIVKASCSHWVPSGCHSSHRGRCDRGRCGGAPSIHYCTRLALVTLRMMEEDTGGGCIGDGEGVMDTLSDRRQIYCALNSSNLINNEEESFFFSLPRLTFLTLTHTSLNSLFLLRTLSHCCSSIHTVLLMLVKSHSFSSLFITRPKLTHWRRKGSAENYETWSAWMWHTTAVVQREIKSKCVAKLSCNNWKEEKNCLTVKCRV